MFSKVVHPPRSRQRDRAGEGRGVAKVRASPSPLPQCPSGLCGRGAVRAGRVCPWSASGLVQEKSDRVVAGRPTRRHDDWGLQAAASGRARPRLRVFNGHMLDWEALSDGGELVRSE